MTETEWNGQLLFTRYAASDFPVSGGGTPGLSQLVFQVWFSQGPAEAIDAERPRRAVRCLMRARQAQSHWTDCFVCN